MANDPAKEPLITIAIATFNRGETLRRAISSLRNLKTDDAFQYEILVVDNGSTDNTAQVVEELQRETAKTIRRVFEPQAGLPFARNRLVKEALGQWIAFFDDDQLAEHDWLWILFNEASRRGLSCTGGSRDLVIETPVQPQLNQYCRYLLGEIDTRQEIHYHLKFLPCTGNVLLSKSVFERIGVFNDTVIDGGEDTEFFNRMLDAGIEGVYIPSANVKHLIPPSRLEAHYLTWIAFRYGLHFARRDVVRKGRLAATTLAILRGIHYSLVTLPRMVWGRICGRAQDVVAMQCKANVANGYIQYLIYGNQSPALLQKTIHRGRS